MTSILNFLPISKMQVKSATSKNVLQHKKSPKKVTARNSTHLYLQDKSIAKIPHINLQPILSLYLHNNEIEKIENLDTGANITHLYLQNNNISTMENLGHLKNLKKLYIGQNKISVLEGLVGIPNLEELHIEKQNLPVGTSLCFDPRTIVALSKSLLILDISCNRITTIGYLSTLKHIRKLNAEGNKLDNIKDICDTVRGWFYLKEASFINNPICKIHRYRESIIADSYAIEILDNKIISAQTRAFIKRFEQEKLANGTRNWVNLADKHKNLPQNYPPPLQKAVSTSILKTNADRRNFIQLNENVRYIPWNALPKASSASIPHRLRPPQKKRK